MYKIIKFYSDTCAPCKAMAPIFDDIAEELSTDNVVFGSTNIGENDNRAVAQSFGVRGLPTVVILKDDEAVGIKTGAQTKDSLKEFITDTIGEAS